MMSSIQASLSAVCIILITSQTLQHLTVQRLNQCEAQWVNTAFGYRLVIHAATPFDFPAIAPIQSYAWPQRYCGSSCHVVKLLFG